MRVTEIERRGAFTWVTGRVVTPGKNVAKKMTAGPTLDFGPKAPDWPGIAGDLGQMKTRMTREPWTHGDVLPPATPSLRVMPANLRAAVEGLA
jgi:hypothetical protein